DALPIFKRYSPSCSSIPRSQTQVISWVFSSECTAAGSTPSRLATSFASTTTSFLSISTCIAQDRNQVSLSSRRSRRFERIYSPLSAMSFSSTRRFRCVCLLHRCRKALNRRHRSGSVRRNCAQALPACRQAASTSPAFASASRLAGRIVARPGNGASLPEFPAFLAVKSICRPLLSDAEMRFGCRAHALWRPRRIIGKDDVHGFYAGNAPRSVIGSLLEVVGGGAAFCRRSHHDIDDTIVD